MSKLIASALLAILAGCAPWAVEAKGKVQGPGHYAGYVPSLAGASIHFIRAF